MFGIFNSFTPANVNPLHANETEDVSLSKFTEDFLAADKRDGESSQLEQAAVEKKSLLRQPPVRRMREFSDKGAFTRNLAEVISNSLSEPIIKNRCTEFLKETKHFSDISESMNYAFIHPENREHLIRILAQQHEKEGISWIPLYENFICRIDDKTISFINVSDSSAFLHQSAMFTEKDFLDGNVKYRQGIKAVQTFKHPTGETLKGETFFKVLLNHCFNSQDANYYYSSLPAFCELEKVIENDYETHPERYRILEEMPDLESSLKAGLYFSLNGIFEKSDACSKEGAFTFEKEFYYLRRFIFTRDLHQKELLHPKIENANQAKTLLGDIEKHLHVCLDLIKSAKKLLDSKAIPEENFKELYATYLDLKQCKITISEQHQECLSKESVQILYTTFIPHADLTMPLHPVSTVIAPALETVEAAIIEEAVGKMAVAVIEEPEPLNQVQMLLRGLENPLNADSFINQFTAINNCLEHIQTHCEDQCNLTTRKTEQGEIEVVENIIYQHPSPADISMKNEVFAKLFRKIVIIFPDSVKSTSEIKNFWDSIPEERLRDVLSQLETCAKWLHKIESLTTEKNPFLALLHYQILAATDAIARRSAPAYLENFQIYHHQLFHLLRNHTLVLDSAKLQQKVCKLAKYFDPQFTFHKLTFIRDVEDIKKDILDSAMSLAKIETSGFFDKKHRLYFLEWLPKADTKTYQFYKQFIDLPAVQAEWLSMGAAAPRSEEEKILWLVQEAINGENILPPAIYALQRGVVNCISCFSSDDKLTDCQPEAHIIETKDFFGRKSFSLRVLAKGLPTVIGREETITDDMLSMHKLKYYKTYVGSAANVSFLSYTTSKTNLYFNTQNRLVNDPDKEYKLIFSNPLDSINRFIGYHLLNLKSLLNEGRIKEFSDVLFQFQRLETAIKYNPEIILRLNELFRAAVEQALEDRNFTAIKNLSIVMYQAGWYLKQCEAIPHPLLDPVQLLHEYIPHISDPLVLNHLHEILLKFPLDDDQKMLSEAVRIMTMNTRSKERDFQKLLPTPQLFNVLSTSVEFRQKVFSDVASIYQLKESFGEIVFNAEKGVLTDGEMNINLFSAKITDNEGNLYSNSTDTHLETAIPRKVIRFSHDYGVDFEQVVPENYKPESYSKSLGVDGVYTFKPKEEESDLPVWRVDRTGQIERNSEGKRQLLMRKTSYQSLLNNYPNLFPVGKYAFWMDAEAVPGEDVKIVAVPQNGPSIKLKGRLVAGNVEIREIKCEGKTLCDRTQVSPAVFDYFRRFESSERDLEFWKHSSENRLEKIILHGSKLSFSVDSEGRIESDQHRGFYVTENDLSVRRLPFSRDMITLTDKKKNTKYLIKTSYPGRWAEIDLIGDKFVGANRFSQLHLAQLYATEKNFDDVATTITNALRMTALDEEEKQIIQSIKEACKGKNVHEIAIRLKANLLIQEAQILTTKLSDAEKQYFVLFRNDYLSYLSQSHRRNQCALTNEEERQILKFLIQHTDKNIFDLLNFTKKEDVVNPVLGNNTLTDIWDVFVSRHHLKFFKDRLQVLQGSSSANLGSVPLLAQYFRAPMAQVDSERLSRWLKLNPMPSEDDFNNLSIHLTKAPPLADLEEKFFVYYEFLRGRATDQQRRDFAKSLDLILHNASSKVLGLIPVLKGVCKFPANRPSLATLHNSHRKFEEARLEVNHLNSDKDSVLKILATNVKHLFSVVRVKLILSYSIRFHWIRHLTDIGRFALEVLKELAHSWWNSAMRSRPIRACISPWTRPLEKDDSKTFRLGERDAVITQNFQTLVESNFNCEIITKEPEKILLAGKEKSPVIEKRIKREQENLDLFLSLNNEKKNFTFKHSAEELKSLILDLKKRSKDESTNLKIQRTKLLAQANRIQNENFVSAAIRSALHNELTIEEMFTLFGTATEEQFKAKTAFENQADFQQFLIALTDHYIRVSRNQQLANVIKILEKADKVPLASEDSFRREERNMYLNEAAKLLSSSPAYTRGTGRKERILLAQEISLKLLIRPDQIDKVNEVNLEEKKHGELLVEAPFGWGKSKVFRILMNILKGNGEHFVTNILPSTQELTLAEQLQQQMNLCWGKKITHLAASRETEFSKAQLQYLYVRMQESIKLGRAEAVRPETYQALELQMLMLCYHGLSVPSNEPIWNDYFEKIGLYLKILRVLRVQGWAGIEEENEVLNNKNKLIFATGERNVYSLRYSNVVKQMMEQILSDGELRALFKLKENKEEDITDNDLKTIFMPKAIEYFASIYGIEGDDKVLFEQFISCPEDSEAFKKSFSWAEKQDNRDLYAFLKGLIHVCLPIACKGRINAKDGYGLSRLDPNLKVPIPFLAKDTPKETSMGPSQYFPDIALLRGYFYYMASGLQRDEVGLMIQHLKAQAKAEAQERSIEATQASKTFAEFVESVGLPSEQFKLSKISKSQLRILAEKFHNHEGAIGYFVHHVMAPQIDIYPVTLESSAQNLRSMFASSLSLSATPQHAAAHGPKTKFIPMKGTAGGITHLLLTKSGSVEEARLNVLTEIDPKAAFEESAADAVKERPNGTLCSAIVEVSPTFIGMSNLKAAEKLAEKLKAAKSTFQGVLFCDEVDKKFKVLDLTTNTVQLLLGSTYEEEELFKYYSPENTFNTDWKSAISAYFKLVVGPNSTWDQIGQGAGRARLIHLMQKIEFEIHQKTLEKHFNGKTKITPMEMLNFLLSNSAIAEASNNFFSLTDQMDDEVRRAVLDNMCGLSMDRSKWKANLLEEIDPRKAWQIFKGSQEVFISHNGQRPWDAYSNLKKGCKASEQLSEFQRNSIRNVGNTSLGFLEKYRLKKNLREYSKKWQNDSEIPFPDSVNSLSGRQNAQVEILREVHQVKVIDAGIEDGKIGDPYTPDKYHENLDLFAPGWEKPSFFMSAAHKIFKYSYFAFQAMSVATFFSGGLAVLASAVAGAETAIFGVLSGIVIVLDCAAVAAEFIASTNSFALITLGALGLALALAASSFALKCAEALVVRSWAALLLHVGYDMHYVKDIVSGAVRKKTKRAAELFDYNYIVTNNKMKLWSIDRFDSQVPFKKDAKPLLQIMIIVDRVNGEDKLTFVDIDANDSQFFIRKLMEDNDKTSEEVAKARTRQIAIYDVEAEDADNPQARFIAMGKNGMDIDSLLKNTAFHAGVAQAKLYNGYLKFTDSELTEVPRLVERIYGETVDKGIIAENFFTGDVLPNNPKKRKQYPDMPLSRVLTLAKTTAVM